MNRVFKCLITLLFTTQAFASSLGEDVNNFALALFSKFEENEDNLAVSPYSIFSNLALLYYGAQGQTASQIKSALHLSKTNQIFLETFHRHFEDLTKEWDNGYRFNIANGLFPHKGTHFLTHFKDIAENNFNAKLYSVDFDQPSHALRIINEWVNKSTNGKISAILKEDDIDNATRLVVANACYFSGRWSSLFRDKKMDTFHHLDGSKTEGCFLHQTSFFPYYEDESVQVVALPFVRNDTHQPFLECFLFLPKKRTLTELEQTLSAEKIDTIFNKLQSELINLTVPPFCFSKKLSLKELLKALGMQLAFGFQADFSNIDGMKDLFLNKVLHETYFSFHETGVTAAAATTSNIGFTSIPPQEAPAIDFHANHPFLFMIVDYHSHAILFMGRVVNPETRECDED